MSAWYEHRANLSGCHVIAYIGGSAAMQGKIDRFGYMPHAAGVKIFKWTIHGWELEYQFTDCVLLWEESEFKDIRCSDAKPGDYAVIGTHKYKITEKHDNSFILEGLDPMDIHFGVIDYCLTKVDVLPKGQGYYTDRDQDVLYQTAKGDWYVLGWGGDGVKFAKTSKDEIEKYGGIKALELPE